jgi:hypothetical protein
MEYRVFIPFLSLQNKKIKNRRSNSSVSAAAARERRCLTSDKVGRRIDKLIACGMFFTKLEKVGSNFFIGTDEFPTRATKSFCFATTAWGKSKLLLMNFAVKKKITKKI